MKLKIRSYLGGGLMTSIYLPVMVTPTSTTALYAINLLNGTTSSSDSTSKSSKDGSITEKELYTGLYKTIAELGLLSDSQVIIKQLQRNLFNNKLLDPLGTTQDLSSLYLKALNYVSQAKKSQELYNSSYQQAVANDSIKEAAVTSDGKVVVEDEKGNISAITPELYKQNEKSYRIVTNGKLLAERYNNPKYAFLNSLLEIVQNGTSSKEIANIVKEYTAKLGSTSNDITGYTSIKDLLIAGGIALLQTAAAKYGAEAIKNLFAVNGLYEIGIKDKNSLHQVDLAISTVFLALSPGQQTLLLLKSDGTKKGALGLVAQMIGIGASNEFTFKADIESGVDAEGNKVGKSASSGDGLDNTTASLITNIQRGIGGNEQTYVMNPGGTAELSVTGTHYGLIYTPDGKAIGKTSLDEMLQSSMLLSVTDVNTIYFGDLKISADKLKDVTYENLGATKVLLPAVLSQSLWRPNFEYFERYEEAAKAVRAKGLNPNDETDKEAMKALAQELEKLGLYDLIDRSTGLPNTKLVRPFLITTGYATTKSGILDSKYINEVDDKEVIDSVISTLSTKGPDGKIKKYDFDTFSIANPFDWLSSWHDHIYLGTIYIPINTNELAGATASGQKIKSQYAQLREQEYLNYWKKISNASTTNSDILK